jgi:hypothetical protein
MSPKNKIQADDQKALAGDQVTAVVHSSIHQKNRSAIHNTSCREENQRSINNHCKQCPIKMFVQCLKKEMQA